MLETMSDRHACDKSCIDKTHAKARHKWLVTFLPLERAELVVKEVGRDKGGEDVSQEPGLVLVGAVVSKADLVVVK